ncbi:MAG: UDP-N-acetylmuramate--L-alanine ligase [Bacteroidetes bacterium HGW-Bacteroidetes-1]|jgi:UDP-N-acetylmuramate--alanine ligase|nr:MAG: UDP-N-acetylmuramate--L-alanine ligase [Bacteroidetes bacterium HGW-Bacteroidetes-1]
MKYGKGHTIYFLGIGGIGMSALARYFHQKNAEIWGYDRVRSKLTDQLEKEGMHLHFEDDLNEIPKKIDLVIYTPAIPKNLEEFKYFSSQKVQMMKRAEVLGALTENFYTIAIAGTHGKTTITSMIAHILHTAGKNITAFIGGIANNFGSNLVADPDSEFMIVEADEFDKSFLQLKPEIAVITSTDADHLDIYKNHETLIHTFEKFIHNIEPEGLLILKNGIKLKKGNNYITYGFPSDSNAFADQISIENGSFFFNLHLENEITKVKMQVPGRHNIENALAAAAVASKLGIKSNIIALALSTYKGVWRRFDIKINTPSFVYIDDYAHHPAELHACISTAKELFPDKKITGVFQPHLFTRTRDLMDEFSQSLGFLDELILLDIYPARELPIPGISSQALLEKIILKNKFLVPKQQLIAFIDKCKPQVLITLGAGDIDQLVEPIQHHFELC